MLNIASGAITYDKCEDIVLNSENDSDAKRRKLAGITNSITISYSVAALDEADATSLQNTLKVIQQSEWRGQLERDGVIISNVINDFGDFESQADVIVANRKTPEIEKLGNKVFSRDVFGDN